MRTTLQDEGYLEIETPVLQLIHGGAKARPFRTHINAFDQEMTLRIALELNLKKAVVGGVDKVFEIGRIFRNEGVDSTHSPEFTMLEVYQAYGDQFTMAELMRRMVLAAADAVGSRQIETEAGTIDLDGEWRWLPVYDAVSEAVGETVTPDTDAETLRGHPHPARARVRPGLGGLAPGDGAARRAGRARPAAADLPLRLPAVRPAAGPSAPVGPAPDRGLGPDHRRRRARHRVQRADRPGRSSARCSPSSRGSRAAGDVEAMQLDEDFLRALEYGAPPMGGLGLGMDRLIMLFTGAGLRETILFPHLKPEVVR